MSRFQVKKVAVLGAGVMGAQIAAHLVNVRVPVVLFDLAAKEGPKNGIVTRAIDNLKKLKPAPLGDVADAGLIEQANYDDNLDLLGECDLVIEAIAERMDWKLDLYKKIAPHVAKHAILASNTSGLSITKLSEALPEALKPRFCGIHFFNPPRYMFLVELINTPTTQPQVLDDLEAFVTSTLGKGVVRAHDTPNFIANRVGIAGMLATLKEVEKFGLTPDVVDDLTGKKLGRASSGTFRTADVVGLDTMAHVVKTLQDNLNAETDPFYANFATPPVLAKLLELKNLGQKTKAGFFKKVGRDILRFDLQSGDYVPAGAKADEVYGRMLKKPAGERLKLLRESEGPQGQFLWAILRDGFHYAAVHLGDIAESARDIDFAMRWGFGMKQGPFELWQEAGWAQVAKWVQEDIDAGKALSSAPLPKWVFEGPVAEAGGVHTPEGSWSASQNKFVPQRKLPVHDRQLFPESVLGANAADANTAGTTISDEGDVRVWTLDGEVLIASIHSKMHAISPDVAEALGAAVDLAEAEYKGLVIWSPDEMFSVGADLQAMLPAFVVAGIGAVEGAEEELQNVMLKIRYANVPVVSAVRGLALGGGCELAVYSSKRVAAMESYIGLVEVGVGLIPGAGGLTYIAPRGRERLGLDRHRPAALPHRRLHGRGDGEGGHGRARFEEARLPARQRRDRAEQGRTALRGAAAGQGHGRRRLSPAAAPQLPRGGPQRRRDDQGPAREHARRRLHQRARLPHREPDRERGHRRRRGRGLARDRGIPDGAGTQGVLLAHRASQDAGADHGDAEHGKPVRN